MLIGFSLDLSALPKLSCSTDQTYKCLGSQLWAFLSSEESKKAVTGEPAITREFLARKMRIRTMSIIPWCRMLCNVSSCIYIETHSMMHQSEFDATNVALSRAADKRKSLINIHKNWYTATFRWRVR